MVNKRILKRAQEQYPQWVEGLKEELWADFEEIKSVDKTEYDLGYMFECQKNDSTCYVLAFETPEAAYDAAVAATFGRDGEGMDKEIEEKIEDEFGGDLEEFIVGSLGGADVLDYASDSDAVWFIVETGENGVPNGGEVSEVI